ncbi:MAG: hypothetical protein GXO77_00025, partial [Calditrichaeota bacterium]|nr:hypothetical protein [Calditrichota bacterium]
MAEITISEIIKRRIPNFKLGIVEGNEVKIDKEDERFPELYEELVDYIKKTFAKDPLSSNEIIGHVRRLYRRIGWEPTRYRPSSEALARRILQNKGWYRINNAVDLGNLVSARFHLPMGLYDLDKINGPVQVDVGRPDESYEGISKSEIHAEGKLILRDQTGIFGNPTADSKRTSVDADTRNILAV